MKPLHRTLARASSLAAAVLLVVLSVSVTAQPLVDLARVGPWPTLSHLIAFDGRLWFVNSVRNRDHNSADIYSWDPRQGHVRYERQLFSQDAGTPVVAGGLLYWPYEDSRASLGWGQVAVTDGEHWQLRIIPAPFPRFIPTRCSSTTADSMRRPLPGMPACRHRTTKVGHGPRSTTAQRHRAG